MNDFRDARPTPDVMNGPPTGYFVVVPQTRDGEDVDLAAVLWTLAGNWKVLAALSVALAIVALGISLLLPKTYKAEATVSPVTQRDSETGGDLRGQLGGLASLVGINLSDQGGMKATSIETLKSSGFARDFILHENLMPVLFADRWDSRLNRWRSDKEPPTLEAGVRKLTKKVRSIDEDQKTGMVTVTVEWYSPQLAAQWANATVDMVNDRLRSGAIRDANLRIEYLKQELAKTTIVGVQQGIDHLIEDQINDAMLANVQREYAFRFIDHAVPPDVKASPNRTLITAVGALSGLLIGSMITLLSRPIRRRRAP